MVGLYLMVFQEMLNNPTAYCYSVYDCTYGYYCCPDFSGCCLSGYSCRGDGYCVKYYNGYSGYSIDNGYSGYSESSGLGGGEIAGIVIGGLVGVVLFMVCISTLCKRCCNVNNRVQQVNIPPNQTSTRY